MFTCKKETLQSACDLLTKKQITPAIAASLTGGEEDIFAKVQAGVVSVSDLLEEVEESLELSVNRSGGLTIRSDEFPDSWSEAKQKWYTTMVHLPWGVIPILFAPSAAKQILKFHDETDVDEVLAARSAVENGKKKGKK